MRISDCSSNVYSSGRPAEGEGLSHRLLRAARHLTPKRGDGEAGDEHDGRQGKADHQRSQLQAGTDQADSYQAGGDEAAPAGDLDAVTGEAEQRREQRERGHHGESDDDGGADGQALDERHAHRSEEHTSEPQSLMRNSY